MELTIIEEQLESLSNLTQYLHDSHPEEPELMYSSLLTVYGMCLESVRARLSKVINEGES